MQEYAAQNQTFTLSCPNCRGPPDIKAMFIHEGTADADWQRENRRALGGPVRENTLTAAPAPTAAASPQY